MSIFIDMHLCTVWLQKVYPRSPWPTLTVPPTAHPAAMDTHCGWAVLQGWDMGKTPPPHAKIEERLPFMGMCRCVCARVCVCVHVLMSQGEHWVLPLGHHSSLALAVSASETFQPNVKRTNTTTQPLHCTSTYACGFLESMHGLYIQAFNFNWESVLILPNLSSHSTLNGPHFDLEGRHLRWFHYHFAAGHRIYEIRSHARKALSQVPCSIWQLQASVCALNHQDALDNE